MFHRRPTQEKSPSSRPAESGFIGSISIRVTPISRQSWKATLALSRSSMTWPIRRRLKRSGDGGSPVDCRGRATQLAERRPPDAPSTAMEKPPLHWLLVGRFRDRRRDGSGTAKDDLYVRLEPALFGANTYGVAHPVQASRPGLSSGYR